MTPTDQSAPERSLVERLQAILRHGISYDDADSIKDTIDRLTAMEAEIEAAYAKGFHDAQEKARLSGEYVVVDSPELVRLRNALEFYADPDTYFAIGFLGDHPCGEFINDSEDDGDFAGKPGARARAALTDDASAGDVRRSALEDIAAGRGMFGINSAADAEWAMEIAGAALSAHSHPQPAPTVQEAAINFAALLRAVQYDNGCRLKDGRFHRNKRPVDENPCQGRRCGCLLEAEAFVDEERRALSESTSTEGDF